MFKVQMEWGIKINNRFHAELYAASGILVYVSLILLE